MSIGDRAIVRTASKWEVEFGTTVTIIDLDGDRATIAWGGVNTCEINARHLAPYKDPEARYLYLEENLKGEALKFFKDQLAAAKENQKKRAWVIRKWEEHLHKVNGFNLGGAA